MVDLAIYPGSFDPISNGHLDLIKRISKIFDRVIILVAVNPNKSYTFTLEERVQMISSVTKDLKNVTIESSPLLVVDYAKTKGKCVLVRGVRNSNDYLNEITQYDFNHNIDPDIDTLFLFPASKNLYISSSAIKELALFHDDISSYVPKEIAENVVKKIRLRNKRSS